MADPSGQSAGALVVPADNEDLAQTVVSQPVQPVVETPTVVKRALKSGDDFFIALRQLESAHRDKPRVGYAKRISDDFVELNQSAYLHCALQAYQATQGDAQNKPVFDCAFFGLLGPQAPLPLHITEWTNNRVRHHKDDTFLSFLNLFNHRLLSLFYRAWADADPCAQSDRPEQDQYRHITGAMGGYLSLTDQKSAAARQNKNLYYTQFVSDQVRHPEGLQRLLQGILGCPVKINEWIGGFLPLAKETQTMLGERSHGQLPSALGVDSWLGQKVRAIQHKFEVCLGPLSWQEFTHYLPDGERLPKLQQLIAQYAGYQWSWQLRLILDKVPTCTLGSSSGLKLGWSSWLGHTLDAQSHTEVVFSGQRKR